MTGRRSQPRSALPSSKIVAPEFGARHPIVWDEGIDIFIFDAYSALGGVIPDRVTVDDHARNRKVSKNFRIYEDPDRAGISVLERRLPRVYAQRQRVKWTRQDVGRIKGGIQNEVARLSLSGQFIDVTFTDVVRLGDSEAGPNATKLGLVVDQKSTAAELLIREHEIVVAGIESGLKRFKYPYDSYVPHWTVARVSRGAGVTALNNAVASLQELMPLAAQIEPLKLYSQQDIDISFQSEAVQP